LREKEIEADNKDRVREREELEELKKRLAEKGLHEDVEAEAKRIQNDENTRMKKKFEKFESESSSSESEEEPEPASIAETATPMDFQQAVESQPSDTTLMSDNEIRQKMLSTRLEENGSNGHEDSQQSLDSSKTQPHDQSMSDIKPSEVMSPNTESQSQSSPTPQSPSFAPLSFKPIGKPIIQLKTSSSHQSHHHHHPVAAAMNQAFAADQDDEDQTSSNKRAKLAQLTQSADERKKQVKRLVESIPTDRDELFNYNIDWTQLDAGLMDKRIKPWINKKIVEYIGEEEQSLNEFICTKIEQRQRPERLLEEVKVILDEEAELFVKKLWRLIVYETESKRCGLSK